MSPIPMLLISIVGIIMAFLGSSAGKRSSCNAEDLGSVPGLEDPLEEDVATHSSILAWRIPLTEEPGGLHSPWGLKESGTTEVT